MTTNTIAQHICKNCGISFDRKPGKGRKPQFHSPTCRHDYFMKAQKASFDRESAAKILAELAPLSEAERKRFSRNMAKLPPNILEKAVREAGYVWSAPEHKFVTKPSFK